MEATNGRPLGLRRRGRWTGWRGNVALLMALVLVLAACGGATGGSAASDGVAQAGDGSGSDPGASATPSASKDPEEAMLAFAKCMRENGVDMPAPNAGGGGGLQFRVDPGEGGGGPDFASEEFQKAEAACREHLEGAGLEPGGAGELSEEAEEAMLEFAKCMREQGIDMPDPDAKGLFRIEPDQGFDPQSAKFREAREACEKYLAEMGPPPELSEEDRKKMEEQMLAFAKCMREQGVDMPDPKFEEGGFTFEIDPGEMDPSDPDFRAAEQECRQYSPELNPPDLNR